MRFIGDEGGRTEASLLFPPSDAPVVSDAAGRVRYAEGADYLVHAEAGRLVRTPTSRMPLSDAHLLATLDPASVHERTVTVSYAHAPGLWAGCVPPEDSALLPRTASRLRDGDALTICIMGDSISEGYDASGFRNAPPYQPPYAELLAKGLELTHGREVQLHNLAVAGWTTEHGEWQTPEVASHRPDVVIIAFGMNDASYAEPADYAARVSAMMRGIRDTCPESEFVLVSPMLPTPACEWVVLDRFDGYRDRLLEMRRPGVAVADVSAMWRAIVDRKHSQDLSGNGTNHPNDFGHRVYAQTLLATFCSSLTP